MPSPPKYHPHKSVLFVTFSLEEGLLLLANPLCLAIIRSCLARAMQLHPILITHFLVEGTHLHLFIVVNDPDDVPGFMSRFKTESAHMLNRVLGRKKRTIWCDGYDSPIVLTPTRALIAISYIYANPAKDNLEETIEKYPGLSSWEMFRSGDCKRSWKRFRRSDFRALSKDSHNLRGYTKEAARIDASSNELIEFELKPQAWLEAFGIKDPAEQELWNKRLLARIEVLEQRAREKRQTTSSKVMGREKLIAQPMDRYYQPRRFGRRMWCLADHRSQRVAFINFMKDLISEGRRIYRKWFLGDFTEIYPPGLYPPAPPKLAEPIAGW